MDITVYTKEQKQQTYFEKAAEKEDHPVSS